MKADEAADEMMFQRVAPIKKVVLECMRHLESTDGGEKEKSERGGGEGGGVMSTKKRLEGLDRRKMSFHFSSGATFSLMTRRNATASRRLRPPPVCCESHHQIRSHPGRLAEHGPFKR